MGCGQSTSKESTIIKREKRKVPQLKMDLSNLGERRTPTIIITSEGKVTGREMMTNKYKINSRIALMEEAISISQTPETGTGSGSLEKKSMVKSLEFIEPHYSGSEEKLIKHFKFCFDEQTGKVVGFQHKQVLSGHL